MSRKRKLWLLWLLGIMGCLNMCVLFVIQMNTPLFLFKDQYPDEDTQRGGIQITRNLSLAIYSKAGHRVYQAGNITANMTVVTAYFDIGDFVKGRRLLRRQLYEQWANFYGQMFNPMVIYTDSRRFYNHMKNVRKTTFRLTKLFLVNRNNLWSFDIMKRINQIYKQKNYPRHYPNTVKPAYSSAQHAKFELLADTLKHKFFKTEFYCWLDIGYFRDVFTRKDPFVLIAPPDLNSSLVAVTEIAEPEMNLDFINIVYNNKVWIGGGMYVGTPDVLLQLEKDYKTAVHYLLDQNLMNTDQQVMYVLFSKNGRDVFKPVTQLQFYPANNNWYRLGYLSYRKIK
ncbi:uncharacterized protein [Haliotis cracherodii]|uniref:uncharacterized protein n=1 Tax=Haliotis cracherodii TaxID=6455 RepID=UPI0039E9C269